jgi:hypothetical protein
LCNEETTVLLVCGKCFSLSQIQKALENPGTAYPYQNMKNGKLCSQMSAYALKDI